MKEKLDNLVNKGYIHDYKIQNNSLIIRYSLSSVGTTERIIDINGKDLKKALFESGEDIRIDIESSLIGDDDFFGYDNAEDLEDRIIEETEFLKELSKLV